MAIPLTYETAVEALKSATGDPLELIVNDRDAATADTHRLEGQLVALKGKDRVVIRTRRGEKTVPLQDCKIWQKKSGDHPIYQKLLRDTEGAEPTWESFTYWKFAKEAATWRDHVIPYAEAMAMVASAQQPVVRVLFKDEIAGFKESSGGWAKLIGVSDGKYLVKHADAPPVAVEPKACALYPDDEKVMAAFAKYRDEWLAWQKNKPAAKSQQAPPPEPPPQLQLVIRADSQPPKAKQEKALPPDRHFCLYLEERRLFWSNRDGCPGWTRQPELASLYDTEHKAYDTRNRLRDDPEHAALINGKPITVDRYGKARWLYEQHWSKTLAERHPELNDAPEPETLGPADFRPFPSRNAPGAALAQAAAAKPEPPTMPREPAASDQAAEYVVVWPARKQYMCRRVTTTGVPWGGTTWEASPELARVYPSEEKAGLGLRKTKLSEGAEAAVIMTAKEAQALIGGKLARVRPVILEASGRFALYRPATKQWWHRDTTPEGVATGHGSWSNDKADALRYGTMNSAQLARGWRMREDRSVEVEIIDLDNTSEIALFDTPISEPAKMPNATIQMPAAIKQAPAAISLVAKPEVTACACGAEHDELLKACEKAEMEVLDAEELLHTARLQHARTKARLEQFERRQRLASSVVA